MKETYTQHTLNEFFEEFKNLPNSYKIEKVHQLLNNPNAKATHRIKIHFKHLKLIIMTSALILGIFTIFLNYPNKNSTHEVVIQEQIKYTESNNTLEKESSKEKINFNKNSENNDDGTEIVQISADKSNNYFAQNKKSDELLEKKPYSLRVKEKQNYAKWPKDTVLDGKKMFVKLTNEEFLSLGIVKNKDTIYYSRDTINQSFYRIYTCEADFDKHDFFEHVKYECLDTLLPVIINCKTKLNPESEKIWWFTSNKELFETLPERYQYLENLYTELKQLKKENSEHIYVNYFNLNQRIHESRQFSFLDLTDKELKKIGFEFIHDTVRLKSIRDEENKRLSSITFKGYNDSAIVQRKIVQLYGNEKQLLFGEFFFKIRDNKSSASQHKITVSSYQYWNETINPIPILISDTLGKTHKTFWGNSTELDYNTLLPVRIDLEKYNFDDLRNGKNEYIFWYEVNKEFTGRLSSILGNEIQAEYEVIKNKSDQTKSSCNYFEVCKSTLQINNFKLYPNPASNSFTLEFDIKENLFGNISIVNIVGAQLRTLIPNTTFNYGYNTYQMDISGIDPGIYLIYINTNKGFKTQRIIISQ